MILGELITNILVINLDKDNERLEHMEESLKEYDLYDRYVRIPAILGSDLTESKYKQTFNMSTGAIGCGLSHKKVWKYIIDNNLPHALILEDDVTINNLILNLDNIKVPEDWDIIYLGYHTRDNIINTCERVSPIIHKKGIDKVDNHVLKYGISNNYLVGCYAYIVSQKSARKLYNDYNLQDHIDVYIPTEESTNMNIYLIIPKPITHCYQFGSNIERYSQRDSDNLKYKESYYNLIVNNNTNNSLLVLKFNYFLIFIFVFLTIISVKKKRYKIIPFFIIGIIVCIFLITRVKKLKGEWYSKIDNLFLENKNFITKNTLIGKRGSYFDPWANVWSEKGKTLAQGLLEKISIVCKDYNIEWSIFYGSMIGWARHNKDSIPWNDDIDIVIPEKFEFIIKDIFKDDFEFGCCSNPDGDKYNYSKIYWKNKGIPIPNKFNCNQNVSWPFIDIFFYKHEDNTMKVSFDKTIILPRPVEYIQTTFMGVPASIFKNYKYILYQLYGPLWYDTCKSSSYNHKLGIPIYKQNRKIERCSNVIIDPDYNHDNIKQMNNPYLNSLLVAISKKNNKIDYSDSSLFNEKADTSSVFENVWVINLDRQPERWEHVNKELNKIDIYPKRWSATDKQNQEFKNFYDHINSPKISSGELACYMSHKKLWKNIYDSGVQYAMIFEDDIVVANGVTKKNIEDALDNSVGFNIIFIGHCSSKNKNFDDVETKLGTAQCTHAYIISRKAIEKLLKLSNNFSVPIDTITYDMCKDNMCFISKHVKTLNTFASGIIHQDRIGVESNLEADRKSIFNFL